MTHMTAARTEHAGLSPSRTERGHANGRRPQLTRNTPRKRALLEVLEGADGFLSAKELHGRLRSRLAPQGLRVGIATVYMQLRGLAENGAVDILHGDDGETRYWLPRRDAHHHYLVCRSCSRALEIVADPVEEWADALGPTVGFRDVTHTLELFGVCDRCTGADSTTPRQGPDHRSSAPAHSAPGALARPTAENPARDAPRLDSHGGPQREASGGTSSRQP